MNPKAVVRFQTAIIFGIVGLLIVALYAGCASMGRTAMVGAGAAAGAGVGSLAGPAGTFGGAAVGGGLAHSIVETQASQGRAERMEDRLYGAPPRRDPEPSPIQRVPWWGWCAAYWVYLRRSHLMSAISGREPRFDAILRALGWRTHVKPIPSTDAKRARGRLA